MVQKSINFNSATSPARRTAAAPLKNARTHRIIAAPLTASRTLIFAGIVSALGCAALFGNPVAAAAPVEFAQPSVEFGIDLSDLDNGAASLMPTKCNDDDELCGTTSFKVPIQLNVSNASRYNVSIWAETADLTSTTTSKTIPSVSSETTLSQLSNNWGYRWTFGSDKEDHTNPYIAMPTTSTTLHLGGATTTVSSADDLSSQPVDIDLPSPGTDNRYLTLGFGVNIDGDTPAGTYKNKIHIAATASPLKVTLFNLETMQQMTSDICANTTTPLKTASKTDTTFTHHGDKNYVPEVTLKDTRDGKTYLVRKLADGNCWMSQNLAFDFVDDQTLPDLIDDEDNPGQKVANPAKYYTGKTKEGDTMITSGDILVSNAFKLTSANTDLGDLGTDGEWSPSMSPLLPKENEDDPDVHLPVFRTQVSIGDEATGSATHPWDDDGKDGLRSFSNDAAYPAENYAIAGTITGSYNGSASGIEGAVDLDNRSFTLADEGQPYEKYGNLYNWRAATLGSGFDISSGEASASICPKGWRLPANGNRNTAAAQDGTEKSFLNLVRNYDNSFGTAGIGNDDETIVNIASFGNDFATDTSHLAGQAGINAYNQLAEFPLNFSNTGLYFRSNGYIASRTLLGYRWSNTASSDTSAYDLRMGLNLMDTQSNNPRGLGLAIRCVAR